MADEDDRVAQRMGRGMGKGRPHCLETKLGVMIANRRLHSYEVGGKAGVSPRTLTEYLAGRKTITQQHLVALAKTLDCDPADISGDSHDEIVAQGEPVNPHHLVHLQEQQRPLQRLQRRDAV